MNHLKRPYINICYNFISHGSFATYPRMCNALSFFVFRSIDNAVIESRRVLSASSCLQKDVTILITVRSWICLNSRRVYYFHLTRDMLHIPFSNKIKVIEARYKSFPWEERTGRQTFDLFQIKQKLLENRTQRRKIHLLRKWQIINRQEDTI